MTRLKSKNGKAFITLGDSEKIRTDEIQFENQDDIDEKGVTTMSKFEEKCDRNVICPYCGKEDKDSWEIHIDDDETKEHECCWCEKKFHLTCSISRLLTTAPDCELNGAEHKWTFAEEANDARNYDLCDVCGTMRWASDRKTTK